MFYRNELLGAGYQTLINTAWRAVVADAASQDAEDKPITVATLRKVLREELHTA